MNVRTSWASQDSLINGYSQFYTADETITEVQENFDIRRYHSAEGFSVIVTSSFVSATPTITATEQVIVQWHTNPINANREDIKIHFPLDSIINTGSLIEWESKDYLIVSKIKSNQAYKSAQMLECNNVINFYDSDDVLYEIPCVVVNKYTVGNVDLEKTQYISLIDSDILVMIPDTTINRQIAPNYIFKIGLYNYVVTKPDDISRVGCLLLPMKFTEQEQVTPIVDEPEDSGVDYLISGDDEIKVGSTKIYTAEKYVNGVLTVATFTFSIVDTGVPVSAYTLSVVDGNSCTVKCNTAGYTVTLRVTNDGVDTDKMIKLKSRI